MPQALNMPELSVCRHIVNTTIIIVTNVIILEFFSAQFVSEDALQLTILSFFDINTN